MLRPGGLCSILCYTGHPGAGRAASSGKSTGQWRQLAGGALAMALGNAADRHPAVTCVPMHSIMQAAWELCEAVEGGSIGTRSATCN